MSPSFLFLLTLNLHSIIMDTFPPTAYSMPYGESWAPAPLVSGVYPGYQNAQFQSSLVTESGYYLEPPAYSHPYASPASSAVASSTESLLSFDSPALSPPPLSDIASPPGPSPSPVCMLIRVKGGGWLIKRRSRTTRLKARSSRSSRSCRSFSLSPSTGECQK